VAIENFKIQETGPCAGMLWVTFSGIQIHGTKGTPEYIAALRSKAKLVDKVLLEEFRQGTRHFNSMGNLIKTPVLALRSYMEEGGYFIEIPKDRLWKFEAFFKAFGVEKADDRPKDAGRMDPHFGRS